MKKLTQQFRIQSCKNSTSSRFILTDRNIKTHTRSTSNETIENLSFCSTRSRFSNIYYQQELSKVNQCLDSFEISKTAATPWKEVFLSYLNFLESISLVLKNKDSLTSNSIIRAVVGLRKSSKAFIEKTDQKPDQPPPVVKHFRENQSQTYETEPKEPPDTYNEEVFYIQNIIAKAKKLRSGKIIQKLVDLHEDLSKLYTDIPTPTETPEPAEVSIGSLGQRLGITLKLIKSEINENLNKVRLQSKKDHKSTQVEAFKTSSAADQMKEKEQEIFNLKRNLDHFQQLAQQVSESLNKYKSYSVEIENKHNEVKIELIQCKNKLQLAEDSAKSTKARVVQLTEKNASKSRKLQETRQELLNLKQELLQVQQLLKQTRAEVKNMTVINKITEEKLVQIDSAWTQSTGSRFVFEKVSSIEISKKLSLLNSVNTEDSFEETGKSPRSGRRLTFEASPRPPGRVSAERHSKEGTRSPQVGLVKPLVLRDLKMLKEIEASPATIPQIPLITEAALGKTESSHPEHIEHFRYKSLPIIIESKTINSDRKPEKISNFAESLNSFDITSPAFEDDNLGKNSRNAPRFHSRKPSNIRTNLIRETHELSSSSGPGSPTTRPRVIVTSLVYENEIIRQKARQETEKLKNVEENSKGVQCSIKEEKEIFSKKRFQKAETLKVKQKPDPDAFDEETLENLRNMCEKYGIDGFESLPANLKLEIFKSLEGHDGKRCEGECVHLKRLANLKYRARGIPYPIKTSTLTTNF